MSIGNIISKHIRKWQLVLIVLGAFMGLLLTWLPLQLYFDINGALNEQKDLLSNNYFIISKPVTIFNTLGLPSSGFVEDEIKNLKEQQSVSKVGAFTVNRFKASVTAGVPNTDLQLYTEMFFESVPDGFIDKLPSEWYWNERVEEVPVIVPVDYFNLYNFGFAAGQGLPEISGSAAKMISFKINIAYNGATVPFTGRIVGFSERINSVLVPQSFMQYANSNYALKKESDPVRLITEVKDAAAFAKYIGIKGYETNNENLRTGKVRALAETGMKVVLLLGFFIILLSLGSFLQFADLIIARAEYEIQTLVYLGYYYTDITRMIFRYVLILIAVATILTLGAGLTARYFLLQRFNNFFEDPVSFSLLPIGILVLLEIIYLGVNYFNLLRHCKKLSLPKD